jgi:hypothetical protein
LDLAILGTYTVFIASYIVFALGKFPGMKIDRPGAAIIGAVLMFMINNTPPGPGPLGPRRPFETLTFVPGTVLTSSSTTAVVQSETFPVSTINLLENTAQSWYDAGYVNVRRRYSHGLSFLANYTLAKTLTNAPDFRSAMDESTIPQNNNDLNLEKGPGCDVRHRFALSSVYDIPAFRRQEWVRLVTQDWHLSTIYQVQSGMPLTISVFGDTTNSGTVLGENPIRANVTGQPVFGPGTHTAAEWFNPAAFAAPQRLHTAMQAGTPCMARLCKPWTWRWLEPSASAREPISSSGPKHSTR